MIRLLCTAILLIFAISCTNLKEIKFDEKTKNSIIEIKENPELGFHWPYLIYLPENIKSKELPILFLSNNTAKPDDDYQTHYNNAKKKIIQYQHLSEKTGLPLLIFAIPRFSSKVPNESLAYNDLWLVDTQALNRNTLLTNIKSLERIDRQAISVINDASAKLKERNIKLNGKFIPFGFSSSGTFASRLALIYPEKIEKVVAGAPGGWFTLPFSEYQWEAMRYPIGISDLDTLTGISFKRKKYIELPKFYFVGSEDKDDAVPYLDSYSYEDRVMIQDMFGQNHQERYKLYSELMKENKINVEFKFYEDMGHSISAEAWQDIINFINKE